MSPGSLGFARSSTLRFSKAAVRFRFFECAKYLELSDEESTEVGGVDSMVGEGSYGALSP